MSFKLLLKYNKTRDHALYKKKYPYPFVKNP